MIMEKTRKKKRNDSNFSLLQSVSGVKRQDVVEIADFGHFFIVLTKDGAIYHSFLGFEVRCKAWVMGLDGKACDASLYIWLRNLVELQKDARGKEDEVFPETDVTYSDLIDGLVVMTEANLCYPMTAFVDMNTATNFADERIKWLMGKAHELETVMSSDVKQEDTDDLKKNFEHGQNAIMEEQQSQILVSERENAGKE